MSITNIEQLRNVLLETIELLAEDEIDIQRAGIMTKSAEGVMSSVKLQLAYNGMRKETPEIDFLQDCNLGKHAQTGAPLKTVRNRDDDAPSPRATRRLASQ